MSIALKSVVADNEAKIKKLQQESKAAIRLLNKFPDAVKQVIEDSQTAFVSKLVTRDTVNAKISIFPPAATGRMAVRWSIEHAGVEVFSVDRDTLTFGGMADFIARTIATSAGQKSFATYLRDRAPAIR